MGFCPVCKSEYKEGITICHDCKVPLVEDLSNITADSMEQEEHVVPEVPASEKAEKEIKNVYVDKRIKAGEYKSSGIVLLGTGILGIIFLILLYMNKIPGLSSVRHNPLFMGVMSVLFVVFTVIGAMTYSKVPAIIRMAEKDEELLKEIRKMMEESLTKEVIDKNAFSKQDISQITNVELYYGREEYMLSALRKAFPDAESALLEMMLDERYNQLYEDNNH